MLKFTTENWNKEQELMLAPSPLVKESKTERNLQVMFTTSSKDTKFHLKPLTYKLIRKKGAGGMCSAAGDPHFTNFGGKKFDFQGCGVYYYVKSETLSVMATLRPPKTGGGVTVCTGLAVRYGKSRWLYGRAFGEKRGAHFEGINLRKDKGGKDFRLTMNDGAVINVNVFSERLDVTMTLPGHYKGKVAGLCGDIGSKSFYKNPGTPKHKVTSATSMGESYKVPPDVDMFKCVPGKCKDDFKLKIKKKLRHCVIPKIPTDVKEVKSIDIKTARFKPRGYIEDDKGPPPFGEADKKKRKPVPKEVPKEKPVSKKCLEAKRKVCKKVLTSAANKILPPDNKIEECAFDICVTGNYKPLEATKRVYQTKVAETARSIISVEQDETKKTEINTILKTIFVKAEGTETFCKNGGTPSPIGCLCADGFSGSDCSIKLDDKDIGGEGGGADGGAPPPPGKGSGPAPPPPDKKKGYKS